MQSFARVVQAFPCDSSGAGLCLVASVSVLGLLANSPVRDKRVVLCR